MEANMVNWTWSWANWCLMQLESASIPRLSPNCWNAKPQSAQQRRAKDVVGRPKTKFSVLSKTTIPVKTVKVNTLMFNTLDIILLERWHLQWQTHFKPFFNLYKQILHYRLTPLRHFLFWLIIHFINYNVRHHSKRQIGYPSYLGTQVKFIMYECS